MIDSGACGKDEDQESGSTEWCVESECRFYEKLIWHKPAGVSQHFQISCLVDLMNNVYEDEETDFEEVLTPEDLVKLKTESRPGEPRVFKPRYKLRVTPQMIHDKLNSMYDMEVIEDNECIPDGLMDESDFSLPEEVFGESFRKKAESAKQQSFVAPQSTGSRTRRKRRDSGETQSSRSSTPKSAREQQRK